MEAAIGAGARAGPAGTWGRSRTRRESTPMLSTITKVPTIRYERRGEACSRGVDPCPDPAHAPVFVYWLKRVRRRARGRASSAMPGGRGASGDSGIGLDCTRGPPHPRAFYRCPVGGCRRHGDHSGNRSRSRAERREQRVAKILGVSVEGRSSLRHTSLSARIRAGSSVLSGRGLVRQHWRPRSQPLFHQRFQWVEPRGIARLDDGAGSQPSTCS